MDTSSAGTAAAKLHEVPPHGKVVRLYPHEGYGLIEASTVHRVGKHLLVE